MTHAEAFGRIMSGEASEWVPNYESGAWGQTIQRWLDEGMPEEKVYLGDWKEGQPFFQIDGRSFARLNIGMIPGFEQEVLEETDRYLVARHASGIVTKALKAVTVRGTRMSMDTYLSHPVTDRASWKDVKR
ncbi:hypothetical protein LCGC14_2709380, partial [marine sediment metagenome]